MKERFCFALPGGKMVLCLHERTTVSEMTTAYSDKSLNEPDLEMLDRLCFTIQRQSADCAGFVQHGIEAEREYCARIAEAEVDDSGNMVAKRIAEKIRARKEPLPLVAMVTLRATR